MMSDMSILFVDDDPFNLKALKRLLRNTPYVLHFAEGAAEALTIMENTPIQIIVTDIKMPEMNGLSLLNIVKILYPDTVRLALSAFIDPRQLLPCINTGEIFRYIIKPVDPGELELSLFEATKYFLMHKEHHELVAELQEKNKFIKQLLNRQKQIERQYEQIVEKLKAA